MAMWLRAAVVGYDAPTARKIQRYLQPLTPFPVRIVRDYRLVLNSLVIEQPELLVLAPTMGGVDGTPTEALLGDFEGMFQHVALAVGPVSREDKRSITAQGHIAFTGLSQASVLMAWDAAVAHHERQRELWTISYVQQSL